MATKTRHQLDAAERDALPDSSFAFPRVRKEPLSDPAHVRNAIARFDQVRDVSDEERDEAFHRLKRAALKFGIEMAEKSWHELGKPTKTMKSSDKPRTPAKASKPRTPNKAETTNTPAKAKTTHAPAEAAKADKTSTPAKAAKASKTSTPAKVGKAGKGGKAGKANPGTAAERTKAELYAEARERGVQGRSSMTKAELLRALEH